MTGSPIHRAQPPLAMTTAAHDALTAEADSLAAEARRDRRPASG